MSKLSESLADELNNRGGLKLIHTGECGCGHVAAYLLFPHDFCGPDGYKLDDPQVCISCGAHIDDPSDMNFEWPIVENEADEKYFWEHIASKKVEVMNV